MLDLKNINERLTTYVRPQTFPVAIRMLTSTADIPAEAKRPFRDLGFQLGICQAMGLARRNGLLLAVTKEDVFCAAGILSMGFARTNEYYTQGNIAADRYVGSLEAGAASEAAMPKLPAGTYRAMLVCPLDSAAFEPDLIVVYGNSAQVMRLVQGALYERGGCLPGYATGRLDCAEIVARTMLTNECQWILPCTGDRSIGATSDDELCFTMPAEKVEEVVAGLAATHELGLRYPTKSLAQFAPQNPPKYQRLLDLLLEQTE